MRENEEKGGVVQGCDGVAPRKWFFLVGNGVGWMWDLGGLVWQG